MLQSGRINRSGRNPRFAPARADTLLVLLLALISSAAARLYVRTSTLESYTIETYKYPRISTPFTRGEISSPLETNVVVADILNDLPNTQNLRLKGSILAITARSSFAHFLDWLKSDAIFSSGVAAILIGDGTKESNGATSFILPSGLTLPFHLAAIEWSSAQMLNSSFYQGQIDAQLTNEELVSPWSAYHQSALFWTLSLGLVVLSIVILFLGIKRFREYRRKCTWKNYTIIDGVVALESIGAILRAIYWIVDPLGQRAIWSDPVRDLWHTITLPFGISATLLLTVFWHETLTKFRFRFAWESEKPRYIAYAIIALVFTLEFVVDTLSLLRRKLPNLDFISSVSYIAIGLSLSLFFIITSSRVLIYLLKSISQEASAESDSTTFTTSPAQRRLAHLGPIAVKLIITAIAWLGVIACGFISLSPQMNPLFTPAYIGALWFGIHYFLSIKAISTILAIGAPKGMARSATGSSTRSGSANSASAGVMLSSSPSATNSSV